MQRNNRTLLAVTLMPLLWFNAFATTRSQQDTKRSATLTVPASRVASITERARLGDSQAEYQLGWSYITSKNVSRIISKA